MIKANARRWALDMSLAIGFLVVMPAMATPPLTTISDTLYRANGSLYSGVVQIEWKSFEAVDQSLVPAQTLSLRVFNGQFRTSLVPTTNASAGAIYTVRYVSDTQVQAVEYWSVPPSSTPVRLTTIRVAPPTSTLAPGGSSGTLTIADVTGLQAALDVRPRKGAGYAPGRAAIINGLGELESALGADSDCITVEGAGATCGAVGGLISFVDGEILSGAVDAVNTVFNLSRPPNPVASLMLYRNGLFQRNTVDFTLSGTTVTFTANAIPQPGDLLVASYRLSGTGVGAPQILCSSVGSVVSAASPTSMGTCTIPAGTLQPGDRVEVSADFTHDGSADGFSINTLWGASSLVSRTFTASETNVAVRSSLGVHTSNSVYGTQSWGALTASGAVAGSLIANYASPLTLDFQGNVTTTGAHGVTLRNYTVIRYPVP